MYQQTNNETKSKSNKSNDYKKGNIIVTWELRHIEDALTRGDVINKNRKNDINHKMLLYAKITTNIYQYPI